MTTGWPAESSGEFRGARVIPVRRTSWGRHGEEVESLAPVLGSDETIYFLEDYRGNSELSILDVEGADPGRRRTTSLVLEPCSRGPIWRFALVPFTLCADFVLLPIYVLVINPRVLDPCDPPDAPPWNGKSP